MKKNGIKQSFSNKKFKMGGFQTLIMIIVIVVVIVINLLVSKMDIMIDLSSEQVFTLTEDTTKLADTLSDDITIYHMCQSGNADERISKVLDQYNKLSHIQVKEKDPVVYPNFAKNYTDADIKNNDVIVVDEKKEKAKYISIGDMIVQDNPYASMMGQTSSISLDAEGQITAAIQSIAAGKSKKIYYTVGHKEEEINSDFKDILSKTNIDLAELSLSKNIPGDCSIIIVNGPVYDFSESEYSNIKKYLDDGGRAIFMINASGQKQSNYNKLLKDYGVNRINGYILDSEPMDQNAPNIISPDIEKHDITNGIDEQSVFVANGVGLKAVKDVRSTLTTETLLKTSGTVFSKTDMKNTDLKKGKKDIDGPFDVAICATDKYPEKTKGVGAATKVVVFGSFTMTDSLFISKTGYGNRTLILQTLNWLTDEETTTLAIPTRSLDEQSVDLSKTGWMFWMVLLVIVIPLGLLGTGLFIWYRRRKK